jgi:hypothetical protein
MRNVASADAKRYLVVVHMDGRIYDVTPTRTLKGAEMSKRNMEKYQEAYFARLGSKMRVDIIDLRELLELRYSKAVEEMRELERMFDA